MAPAPHDHPDRHPRDDPHEDAATAAALADLAEGLAGEFRLGPLLDRVLRAAVALLGCADGSISLVDRDAGTYRKEADVGVACRSGRSFPLEEGMTGAVVRGAAPVVVDEYATVVGGHLRAADRARLHAAVGVPVTWGPAVIGAVVVFAEDRARRFGPADVQRLTLFARHAAIAITNARLHAAVAERGRAEAAALERERAARLAHERGGRHLAAVLVHLDRAAARSDSAPVREALADALALVRDAVSGARQSEPVGELAPRPVLEDAVRAEVAWARTTSGVDARVVVAGQVRAPDPEVVEHLVLAVRTAVVRVVASSRARSLRVGLVHGAGGVVLLVEDDGPGAAPLVPAPATPGEAGVDADPSEGLEAVAALTRRLGGTAEVTSTAGWGTSLRLGVPYRLAEQHRAARTGVLVVDGRPAVRAGLAALLTEAGAPLRVVGDVGRGADVVDAVRILRPDVVVLGAGLRDAHPAEVAEALLCADPELVLVVVEETPTALTALTAPATPSALPVDPVPPLLPGERGRVPADASGPELAQAVVRAVEGAPAGAGRPAPPAPRPAPRPAPGAPAGGPTPREQEVLALLERGLSDREIAQHLVIARKTVEKHVGALLRKHGVHSRAALVASRSHG